MCGGRINRCTVCACVYECVCVCVVVVALRRADCSLRSDTGHRGCYIVGQCCLTTTLSTLVIQSYTSCRCSNVCTSIIIYACILFRTCIYYVHCKDFAPEGPEQSEFKGGGGQCKIQRGAAKQIPELRGWGGVCGGEDTHPLSSYNKL